MQGFHRCSRCGFTTSLRLQVMGALSLTAAAVSGLELPAWPDRRARSLPRSLSRCHFLCTAGGAPLSRLRSVHGAELRMGPITSRDSNSRGAVYDERPNACCGARVPLPGSYFISQPDGRAAAAEIMIVPRTGAPKRPWARLLRSSRRALVVVTPARWLGRPQRRGKD